MLPDRLRPQSASSLTLNWCRAMELTDEKREELRERIVQTFGDWIEVARTGEYIEVVWNFLDEGLGRGYGTVNINSDGYYGDWVLERTHALEQTVCVRSEDEGGRSQYLLPNGSWRYDEPHWYSPKRATTLKNKVRGRFVECLFWYQV